MKCITTAWDLHEQELRLFLYKHIKNQATAEDLLQDVFVKALAKREAFCDLENSRAWLFKVTKNRLIDFQRTLKQHEPIDDKHEQLTEETDIQAPVVHLSNCLPTALKKLDTDDRDIIQACDLDGMKQADYAKQHQLTLVATKSRIQRARKRLKLALHDACKIVLDEQGNVCCFDPKCQ